MKRSEVVNILYEHFKVNGYMIHSDNIAQEVAERVLTKIEELGMLPPLGKKLIRSTMTDDEGNIIFDEMINVSKHEWEDEDTAENQTTLGSGDI